MRPTSNDSPDRRTPTLGVAGIGRMGEAIAVRLLQSGQPVTVWNRTTHKTTALVELGAAVAAEPADLATSVDIVISCLRDGRAVEETYTGQRGLLTGNIEGHHFIEMSTISPGDQEELSRRVETRGGFLVESPVAGSVGPARNGTLLAFVGGRPSAVERVRPTLEMLCRRIEHVGPVGSGTRLKMAAQLPLHVYWVVLAEALTLCSSLDIDVERLVDIIVDTPGAPRGLSSRSSSVVAALRGAADPATFDIDAIRKDLYLMIEEMARQGGDGLLTRSAIESYSTAARLGMGSAGAPAWAAKLSGLVAE